MVSARTGDEGLAFRDAGGRALNGGVLDGLLPRMLPEGHTFRVHSFRGKADLLRKLPSRLRGYRSWLVEEVRIIVLVDRDNDDCYELKQRLEREASASGLLTRSRSTGLPWQVVNRVVIEELEAWYFGDWEAVRTAYPRVSYATPRSKAYQDPDAIRGGTCEAFERLLKRHGYFPTGLRKIEAARAIAAHTEPDRNRSRSFARFHEVVMEAVS